ncbi:MAG: hypothetical protein ABI693_29700, partial [Bryobacteraceae bacterium]
MIGTKLNHVEGPWRGKLALAARPRGGDWLHEEIAEWRKSGVDTIFSLLTAEEEEDLDISRESEEAREQGMTFLSFPIPDRQVPESESRLGRALEDLEFELA